MGALRIFKGLDPHLCPSIGETGRNKAWIFTALPPTSLHLRMVTSLVLLEEAFTVLTPLAGRDKTIGRGGFRTRKKEGFKMSHLVTRMCIVGRMKIS